MSEYRDTINISQPLVLIGKYFSGKADRDEISAIINWKNISSENEMLFNYCLKNYLQNGTFDLCFDIDLRNDWMNHSEEFLKKQPSKNRSVYIMIGVFIMSYLISITAIYFIFHHQ